jgi:uncharacterized SAM-binding protein YcdF (DUF218 family)
MTAGSARRGRLGRALKALAALAAAFLVYLAVVCVSVQRQSERDETRPADAIVVFGAAEYAGRPSPIFRARLDHAFSLWERGLAPMVITTGASRDPRFSEGRVGQEYLMSRGIPEEQLIAETQSPNTSKSAERVAGIMRANGMRNCIAVSDGYHLFRIKRILGRQGVEVYGAPRPVAVETTRYQRFRRILREALGYTAWLVYLN